MGCDSCADVVELADTYGLGPYAARLESSTLSVRTIKDRDMGDEKKTSELEKTLKESEAHYRLLAQNVVDFIWTLDLNLRFLYASPSSSKMLGYEPSEITGQNVSMVLTPESTKKALEIFEEEMAVEASPSPDLSRSRIIELEHIRKGGSNIYVEVRMTFLRDENKRPIGVIGVSRDITERKKDEEALHQSYIKLKEMQNQLIQAEKANAIAKLASGVAHEVKNPLGVILAGVNYLEKRMSPKKKDLLEAFSMVKDGIKRADKIVESLLDFSKPNKLRLKPEDINSILEVSSDLVKTRPEFKNIKVIKEMKKGMPRTLVDRNKIEQVLINVLLNAMQAMPKGGKVIIRSYDKRLEKADGGRHFKSGEAVVVIEVEDEGIGISKKNMKKLFEPFFTTRGAESGTGLGLSITQSIIIMHGGLINVESKKGKGTKVIITLKAAEGKIR